MPISSFFRLLRCKTTLFVNTTSSSLFSGEISGCCNRDIRCARNSSNVSPGSTPISATVVGVSLLQGWFRIWLVLVVVVLLLDLVAGCDLVIASFSMNSTSELFEILFNGCDVVIESFAMNSINELFEILFKSSWSACKDAPYSLF